MDSCRTCMRKVTGPDLHSLFDPVLQPATAVLIASTSLKISREDGLPGNVCNECHGKLTSFHAFCQQSVESDLIHRRNLHVKVELHDEESSSKSWTPNVCAIFSDSPNIETSVKSDEWSIEYVLPAEDINTPFLPPDVDELAGAANNAEAFDVDDGDEDGDEEYDEYDDDEEEGQEDEDNEHDEDHVESVNSTDSPQADKKSATYKCDLCGKQFAQKFRIEGHLREHRGLLPYPCNDCDKKFDEHSKLRLHREKKHTPMAISQEGTAEERFVCVYEGCCKTYKNRRSMGEHVNRIHLGKKKCVESICETCGKSFQTRPNLMQHMKTHMNIDQYPYQCDICQKRFNVQYSFKIHMMRHNNIRNFPCPLCPSRMCTKPELDNHLANHNRDVPWPCAECPSVFNRKASMQRHVLKVHRGHKPYVCTECGRAFGKKWTLKNHILRHTGEKPHACPVCDRRFVQLVTLKTHMKMHNK